MSSEKEEQINKVKEAIKKLETGSLKKTCIALFSQYMKKLDFDEKMEADEKEITQRYEKKFTPLYAKNNELIEGSRAVEKDELKLDNLTQDEKSKLQEYLIPHKINDYWLKVLKNNASISIAINDKDELVLKFCKRIEYEMHETDEDFSVYFHFDENPYFNNTLLAKKFYAKDGIPSKSEGTVIEWKEGKNITKKVTKKKQKNKKTGEKRTITKEEDEESFFNFFKSNKLCEKHQEEEPEAEEDCCQDSENLSLDFDMGLCIMDEAIPYSLEHYLGIEQEEDVYDDEDYDDMDDDEDEPPKKKGKAPHKKSGGDKGGEAKPECKQQ